MAMGRICVGVLVVLLTGCGDGKSVAEALAVPPANVPKSPTPPVSSMTMYDISDLAGVQCSHVENGVDCISGDLNSGDYQTIELKPGCGPGGLFGSITEEGAHLMNRTPPNDTIMRATLKRGENVCIQAIAREGKTDGYYFVTPVNGCAIAPSGRIAVECLSGWVDASDMATQRTHNN